MKRSVCLAALAALGLVDGLAEVVLPSGSTWGFQRGLAEVSDPVSAWRQPEFDGSTWPRVRTPVYFGPRQSRGTFVRDMPGSYTTFFLRRNFVVRDAGQAGALELRTMSDDGHAVWINGVEVARENLAEGELRFDDVALGEAPEPILFQAQLIERPASILVEGENWIAVQVFSSGLDDREILFDLELELFPIDHTPPQVVRIDPRPGAVDELTEITLTFNEPVTGVDAQDLLVNDRSPHSVDGFGNEYTFRFEQPEFGTVEVRWDLNHAITDLARPPNPLDDSAPLSRWQYRLVDRERPVAVWVQPAPGVTVGHVDQVEVLFSEPVQGVDASDLWIQDEPALSVQGSGAGPYLFQFSSVPSGTVLVRWNPEHEVSDLADRSNPFLGGEWTYRIDPTLTDPGIIINEFMAANRGRLTDEDRDREDWIELYNPTSRPVNLLGWALTDDPQEPGRWVFPEVQIAPKEHLVIFASGKDRIEVGARRYLHTNFKLSVTGEYLGLYNAELPRRVVDELAPQFPEQRADFSYGRSREGGWRYFDTPSPGAANGESIIAGVAAPVHFSARRGYYDLPFNLVLSTESSEAEIRYTSDGSEPALSNGAIYTGPIPVQRQVTIRAAAFEKDRLPSQTKTHTYLLRQRPERLSLPAIVLSTDSTNLWGRTGIMEVRPRNTTKRGIGWERPVSVEWIESEDNGGFHADAGLRIQGGNYVRERYSPTASLPFSKYSFRLYFRGDYGLSRLAYPLMPNSPIQAFDHVVLRAGMNDHSNPFIADELVRRLSADTGNVAALGTFGLLYLNGQYEGYYNPTERIDRQFLQSWHGGGEEWDIIAQFNEIREGDVVAWNRLKNLIQQRDLSDPSQYRAVEAELDLVNFIDYLLVNIYVATGDWPHNNWRAARERVDGARFRFYVWDAEWSFGFRNGVSHNTITTELQSDTDIGRFYRNLVANDEFRLLFADRVHRHFYNGGALTDENVLRRYHELRQRMLRVLPTMSRNIERVWVPRRRDYVMTHLRAAGLLASDAAPVLNQHGGKVPYGFELTMDSPRGTVFWTLDGSDPRIQLTGAVSPAARTYESPVRLERSAVVKARSRIGTVWSALTEATFQVAELSSPIAITEVMFRPEGSAAFEFVELHHGGDRSLDVGHFHFSGIDFSFPRGTVLAPGATVVIASNDDPNAFARRHPEIEVMGYFGGRLSNEGERLVLHDASGRPVDGVEFRPDKGWPGFENGRSMELADLHSDRTEPAHWRPSLDTGGSPGVWPGANRGGSLLLSEIFASADPDARDVDQQVDWIEIHNPTDSSINLGGWRLSDRGDPDQFVFPDRILLPGGNFIVRCGSAGGANEPRTGFGLDREGESVFLFNPNGERIDAVAFGQQIPGASISRLPNDWALSELTPGRPNRPAEEGTAASLCLNEWMPVPRQSREGWIELFNRDRRRPVSLRGLGFSDGTTDAQYRSLAFIQPGGFAVLIAQGESGADGLGFELSRDGGRISLFDQHGNEIDRVDYGSPHPGVSEGRLRDGGSEIGQLWGDPTPGGSNVRVEYNGALLSELLVRPQFVTFDSQPAQAAAWIELENSTGTVSDLSGMSLAFDGQQEWRFPAGAVVRPEGRLVVLCDPLRAPSTEWEGRLNSALALNPDGGTVELLDPDGRAVDRVAFGPQVIGLSIGRVESEWQLLAAPTPGTANARTAALGAAEVLRLNEWMAAPYDGPDWFEIYNPGVLPVPLSGLSITDDPSSFGTTKFVLPPLGFVGSQQHVVFIADSAVASPGHVNFSLDRLGETLRLYDPLRRIIDTVDFGVQYPGVSQGRFPDADLRVLSLGFGGTPGDRNSLLDTDHDGLPDVWEREFGLDPLLRDANVDSDGDGVVNSLEYLTGTNPLDPEDHFRLTLALNPNDTAALRFRAAAGRVYRVEYRTSFDSGTWEELRTIPATPQATAVEVLDPAGGIDGEGAVRFYRVVGE